MANQSLQRIYGGADISAPINSLSGVRAIEGDIKRIDVWINSANSNGDTVFQVRKNGTVIPAAEVTILEDETHGFVTLTESVADGDVLTLDADEVPGGGIDSPIEWRVKIDDGVTVGGGSSVGNVHSIDAKPFSDIHPKSDYFENKTQSAARWTEFQSQLQTLLFEDGRAKLIVPSNAGQVDGFFQSLPAGDCTIITKISTNAPKVDFTTIGLALFQDAAANPNTTDVIDFEFMRNATQRIGIAKYADYQTYTTGIGSDFTITLAVVYLRAVRTGTTWTFSYSLDGKDWTAHASTISEGSHFAPKEFGITVVNTVHTNENVFDVEFINYYDYPNAELNGGLVGGSQSSIVENRIICIGDSIVRGYGVAGRDAFPNKLAELLSGVSVSFDGRILSEDDGSKDWKVINRGYDSYTTQNVIDKILPNVILRRDASLSRDIVLISVGTNDIVAGDSASTIYTKLTSLVADLQAEGFEVWICTVIDRDGTGGFDTVRGTLNTAINGNAAGADQVVDLYANANLQDASNSTYFQADGIHPKPAGMTVIAGIIEALL